MQIHLGVHSPSAVTRIAVLTLIGDGNQREMYALFLGRKRDS